MGKIRQNCLLLPPERLLQPYFEFYAFGVSKGYKHCEDSHMIRAFKTCEMKQGSYYTQRLKALAGLQIQAPTTLWRPFSLTANATCW